MRHSERVRLITYIYKAFKVVEKYLSRQSIWYHYLTICLMFVFSMDWSSTWPKISEMAWHLFPNLQGVTWPWVKVEIFFLKKDKIFGRIGKIIWSWSTFNNEPRVNSDVCRRYRISYFDKPKGTNCKN